MNSPAALSRLATFALALAVVVGGLPPAAVAAPPAATLYRHATLIDGAGGPARADMSVLTVGERIVAVGPDAAVAGQAPAGVRSVDLSGQYLLPGLIDSHEHLATPPDRKLAEATLRRDLYGGVTAVRDMADDLRAVGELARASRVGEIPAPDIYYAAFMAGPSFFVDPRTRAANAGVTPGTAPWMQAITPQTDLQLAVARAAGTSATAIKIYANLPGDMVARIAAEAHRQHLQVWAHASVFPASPDEVIAAGPDVVSHVCYLAYQAMGPMPATYQVKGPIPPAPFMAGDNPVMARLFAALKAKGIILDVTDRVYVEDERRFAANPKSGAPKCPVALATVLTRQAWRAGVQISTGTDGTSPWDSPWPAVYDEMIFQVQTVGIPAAEVIRSATLVGARAAGQDADMGTVAPGKLANLVVLARNPLEDMANLRTVTLTVKRGRDYPRDGYRPITRDEFPEDRS